MDHPIGMIHVYCICRYMHMYAWYALQKHIHAHARMHALTHARTNTHTHTQSKKAKPSAAAVIQSHGHLYTTQVLRVTYANPPGGRTGTLQEAIPCLTSECVGTQSSTWTEPVI